MSEMTPKERRQKAKALRDSGMTLKEVGKELGVSPERVRQLCCMAGRDLPRSEIYKLYLLNNDVGLEVRKNVSTRTIHALERNGIQTINQLKEAREADLINMRGIGQKSLIEIKFLKNMEVAL